jgi:hypothetical protein
MRCPVAARDRSAVRRDRRFSSVVPESGRAALLRCSSDELEPVTVIPTSGRGGSDGRQRDFAKRIDRRYVDVAACLRARVHHK